MLPLKRQPKHNMFLFSNPIFLLFFSCSFWIYASRNNQSFYHVESMVPLNDVNSMERILYVGLLINHKPRFDVHVTYTTYAYNTMPRVSFSANEFV